MSDAYVRAVPPLEITDSIFNSSNVTEDDYPVYDAGTTYNDGDYVIITTGVHKIYLSTTTQTGAYPPDNPTTWVDMGATNRWKMFDSSVSSATTNPDEIIISIIPSTLINSIVLMELFGQSVTIKATSASAGVVYNKTVELQDYSEVTDWYQYFYFEFLRYDAMIITDLPAYDDLTIKITIDNTGGTAECGVFVVGRQNILGEALYGIKTGIIDYSVKTTNDEGVTTVTEGAYSKRIDVPVKVENNKFDSVQRFLARNRATPIVYAVGNVYSSNVIYGYYRDFDMTIGHPAFTECSLSIEGLI